MATHSSILAWRIPGIEEPGRLQSVGLQESDTAKPPTREVGCDGIRRLGFRFRDDHSCHPGQITVSLGFCFFSL